MRLYQKLWLIIRDANGATVKISCPPHLRQRIRKAIYKERNLDSTVPHERRLAITLISTGILFRLRGRRVCRGIEIFTVADAQHSYKYLNNGELENESDSSQTC